MNQFDQIENRIKGIFEKGGGLLHGFDQTSLLINKFSEALHGYLLENPGCLSSSPSEVKVYCSSQTKAIWDNRQDWEITFLAIFNAVTTELNCHPNTLPTLILIARNSLEEGDVTFAIEACSDKQQKTGVVSIVKAGYQDKSEKRSGTGKILINLNKAIPLNKAILNLGRKSDNDIVINDLRVSRFHAQIRKTRDGHMVFDVGSSGGTFVNGERITERLLKSGDVISLAGYPLIFNNESDSQMESPEEITANLSSNPAEGR